MKVPDQNELASPPAQIALVKKLWNNGVLEPTALKQLLLKLGYWNHWPYIGGDREIEKEIEEWLEIPHIWEGFSDLPEDQRWRFGHLEILKRHPAYHNNDRIAQAALVAIMPMPCRPPLKISVPHQELALNS